MKSLKDITSKRIKYRSTRNGAKHALKKVIPCPNISIRTSNGSVHLNQFTSINSKKKLHAITISNTSEPLMCDSTTTSTENIDLVFSLPSSDTPTVVHNISEEDFQCVTDSNAVTSTSLATSLDDAQPGHPQVCCSMEEDSLLPLPTALASSCSSSANVDITQKFVEEAFRVIENVRDEKMEVSCSDLTNGDEITNCSDAFQSEAASLTGTAADYVNDHVDHCSFAWASAGSRLCLPPVSTIKDEPLDQSDLLQFYSQTDVQNFADMTIVRPSIIKETARIFDECFVESDQVPAGRTYSNVSCANQCAVPFSDEDTNQSKQVLDLCIPDFDVNCAGSEVQYSSIRDVFSDDAARSSVSPSLTHFQRTPETMDTEFSLARNSALERNMHWNYPECSYDPAWEWSTEEQYTWPLSSHGDFRCEELDDVSSCNWQIGSNSWPSIGVIGHAAIHEPSSALSLLPSPYPPYHHQQQHPYSSTPAAAGTSTRAGLHIPPSVQHHLHHHHQHNTLQQVSLLFPPGHHQSGVATLSQCMMAASPEQHGGGEMQDGGGATAQDTAVNHAAGAGGLRSGGKQERLCGVCGDKALGYNFNAITCESCKAFFRRNALKNKTLKCPFQDNCTVDSITRRFCQKCRLRKCFEVGMRKEWIMTEEEKLKKKQKIEANKLRKYGGSSSGGGGGDCLIRTAGSPEDSMPFSPSPDSVKQRLSVSPAASPCPMQQTALHKTAAAEASCVTTDDDHHDVVSHVDSSCDAIARLTDPSPREADDLQQLQDNSLKTTSVPSLLPLLLPMRRPVSRCSDPCSGDATSSTISNMILTSGADVANCSASSSNTKPHAVVIGMVRDTEQVAHKIPRLSRQTETDNLTDQATLPGSSSFSLTSGLLENRLQSHSSDAEELTSEVSRVGSNSIIKHDALLSNLPSSLSHVSVNDVAPKSQSDQSSSMQNFDDSRHASTPSSAVQSLTLAQVSNELQPSEANFKSIPDATRPGDGRRITSMDHSPSVLSFIPSSPSSFFPGDTTAKDLSDILGNSSEAESVSHHDDNEAVTADCPGGNDSISRDSNLAATSKGSLTAEPSDDVLHYLAATSKGSLTAEPSEDILHYSIQQIQATGGDALSVRGHHTVLRQALQQGDSSAEPKQRREDAKAASSNDTSLQLTVLHDSYEPQHQQSHGEEKHLLLQHQLRFQPQQYHHEHVEQLPQQHLPQAQQHLIQAQQHLPHDQQRLLQAQQHLPQALQHLPQAQQHLPQALQHLPQAQQHLPHAQQHLPQAQQQESQDWEASSYESQDPQFDLSVSSVEETIKQEPDAPPFLWQPPDTHTCGRVSAQHGGVPPHDSWDDYNVMDSVRAILGERGSPNSNLMDSIVHSAVTAEYCCCSHSLTHEEDPPAAAARVSGTAPPPLTVAERRRLEELHDANQAMMAPLSEDQAYKDQRNPSLINVINMTDIAIRRLIQMSKQLSSFSCLCTEDQIALLKGGCTEMMILRSVAAYDADKDSWKIPDHRDTYKSIKLKVLKAAPGNTEVYEEHKRFILSFKPEWRHDSAIMLLLSAITLFTPSRTGVRHAQAIQHEQCCYLLLLKRYLETRLGACEGRSVYCDLLQRVHDLRRLNENHLKLYMQVNPEEVRPLLIEIFDLKPR